MIRLRFAYASLTPCSSGDSSGDHTRFCCATQTPFERHERQTRWPGQLEVHGVVQMQVPLKTHRIPLFLYLMIHGVSKTSNRAMYASNVALLFFQCLDFFAYCPFPGYLRIPSFPGPLMFNL